MSISYSSVRHRMIGTIAVAGVVALALTGCVVSPAPSEPASRAVGYAGLQSATVYIKGQGTFIDPGSLDPAEGRWIGSGFLISPDGLAMTNNHVVTGAGTLNVFVGGEESGEVRARVLGASECLDLAVIQLDDDEYPFLDWYEGEISTGLDVYSAGYPLGAAEEYTLTRGIVSKNDFSLDTQWAALDHVIEHDARIRGGNSGGPLVDAQGRLVGVNYAGDDSLDYNFAIHRDVAQKAIERLAAGERVESIGINAKGWVSEDDSIAGVWVSSVEPGGPADAAGVEPGDLIYKLAGVSVGTDGTLADYCQVLRTQGGDGTFDIQIYRPATDQLFDGQINGKELTLTASQVFGGSSSTTTGGYTTVTDDAGALSVSIPSQWSQVDGAGFTDQGGRSWHSLSAAPDLNAFWGGSTAPGIQFMATAAGTDAQTILTSLSGSFDGSCSQGTVAGPYDDGWYEGVYSDWDCGGTSVIVLSTVDEASNNLVLLMQLQSDYEKQEALPEILQTFQAAL